MPSIPTFTSIASRWLSESAGSVKPETVGHYRWLLENYVCPGIGESLDITEEDVRKLVEEKRAQGLSESTLYSLPKLIRRILSFASAEGLCEPPAWDITLGTPERMKPVAILTPEQSERLSAYLTGNPTPKNLGIYLILTTGITLGELTALTWADVSFPLKRIRVRMERETKTETRKTLRDIPIHERQRIYLKKLSSLPTVYVASGKPGPISRIALRNSFFQALRDLGLPEMTFNDLRRTFAVHCLENGMGYDEVSKVLGRKNDRHFRSEFEVLVTDATRMRLEQEALDARKPRQAPEHIDHPGPDQDSEVIALRQKVEAKKQALQQLLDSLEADEAILRNLRYSDCVQGQAREGFYAFVEKVLGDDRDGRVLVEYLRSNMRVAQMPSCVNKTLSVQAIRRRVAHGFAKLNARLDQIYAVEGYDVLEMLRYLMARIQEVAPPAPKRPGPKGKPSLDKDYRDALAALERIAVGREGEE